MESKLRGNFTTVTEGCMYGISTVWDREKKSAPAELLNLIQCIFI